MAGGSANKQKLNKSKSRKPVKASVFVDAGLLSDWSPAGGSSSCKGKGKNSGNCSNTPKSKSAARLGLGSGYCGKSKASSSNSRIIEPQKPKMNAIGYSYPQIDPLSDGGGDGHNHLNESPVLLVDTKESKIHQTPFMEASTVKYTYSASLEVDDSSHRGLGFCVEADDNPSVVEKNEGSVSDSSSSEEIKTGIIDGNASDNEALSSPEENSGFLVIGGMKLYTHDIPDEEDDEDNEESVESSESDDSSNSSDTDGSYNSDPDVDDEIAKDYFQGFAVSYKATKGEHLAGQVLQETDDDDDISGVRFNDTVKRLGGIALQDASREYGMKKPSSSEKGRAKPIKFGAATDDCSIDDTMLVKDPRSLYAQKKRYSAKLPQSWPSKAEKSSRSRRLPGEKKKLRQDTIALKRRERMIRRGVDLEQINMKLEQMVQNRGDIMSFQLMHSRDCSQVQRLAAIYRLRSGSQGSGKRRFVTVTRTAHTGMPSSSDRVCLEKLIGVADEKSHFIVNGAPSAKKKASKATTSLSPLDSKSAKSKILGESSKKKRRDKDKTGTYAAQPVSFISSGNMVTETMAMTITADESNPIGQTAVTGSSSYGAFEMHTTGFGSRMMAKMGYVDGGGLGKDGRGIAEPIEVIQRPKSLGLGAKAPETEPVNTTPQQRPNKPSGQSSIGRESRGKSGNAHFGSFEKHTKGFGSKMMAKMGFVEGMGLGRDSQGIADPLVAGRLPKSRGLGAKG